MKLYTEWYYRTSDISHYFLLLTANTYRVLQYYKKRLKIMLTIKIKCKKKISQIKFHCTICLTINLDLAQATEFTTLIIFISLS